MTNWFSPCTCKFLELHEINFSEFFSWVFIKNSVFLDHSIKCKKLHQLGHHADSRYALHQEESRLQINGVHLKGKAKHIITGWLELFDRHYENVNGQPISQYTNNNKKQYKSPKCLKYRLLITDCFTQSRSNPGYLQKINSKYELLYCVNIFLIWITEDFTSLILTLSSL